MFINKRLDSQFNNCNLTPLKNTHVLISRTFVSYSCIYQFNILYAHICKFVASPFCIAYTCKKIYNIFVNCPHTQSNGSRITLTYIQSEAYRTDIGNA